MYVCKYVLDFRGASCAERVIVMLVSRLVV